MGDEILMKFYKISIIIASCCLMFANETLKETNQESIQEYDQIFQAINTPRKGLNDSNISKIPDPFLVQKSTPKIIDANSSESEGLTLSLHAIFGDRVKINNKWYKTGEKIGEYKVGKIKKSSVILASKEQNLELNITQGKNNVGIKIK
ncbi:hypothetical protein [Campylobacter sp. CCUG 57310]|uniref:hypothetical protein n=1 Tax=Campylobacter sp. CCUG 57310 TaxID=2517362 RepID=UPI00156446FB|nr:hypothetical protein [Campylobacter sp. CCUG 57310]QKF92277.1 hypothetical protein CORI_1082 [Campylobacter sp. CCUG 57310]